MILALGARGPGHSRRATTTKRWQPCKPRSFLLSDLVFPSQHLVEWKPFQLLSPNSVVESIVEEQSSFFSFNRDVYNTRKTALSPLKNRVGKTTDFLLSELPDKLTQSNRSPLEGTNEPRKEDCDDLEEILRIGLATSGWHARKKVAAFETLISR
uniref:Uncharacterized protein n=1 Tax=Vespula pensylvanica TaxID=30213 RepID=A0A834K1I2_VESPE|nr:hypothetical protein H0235_016421 [Vespula pensylvanica]